MSNGFGGGISGENLAGLLCNYIGETVTIFTKSGGQSGSGFTGVILAVNDCVVRLITRIGPAPGCSLGNACNGFNTGGYGPDYGAANGPGYGAGACGGPNGLGYGPGGIGGGMQGAQTAGGWNGFPVYTVGSVTDIPIDSIASFVHNAV